MADNDTPLSARVRDERGQITESSTVTLLADYLGIPEAATQPATEQPTTREPTLAEALTLASPLQLILEAARQLRHQQPSDLGR